MPKKKETALIIPPAAADTLVALEKMETQCVELSGMKPGMKQVLALCYGVTEMKKTLMDPKVMPMLIELKGSALGFQTDERKGKKDKQGKLLPDIVYGPEVVAEAVIQGRMYGVYPVHNQMNIINKQCYVRKEGFEYILGECDKIEEFWIQDMSFVEINATLQVAYIKGTVCYQFKGEEPKTNEMKVPVKHDNWSSCDQSFGKAKRKMYAWLYERATGKKIHDGDVESATVEPNEIRTVATDVTDEKPEAMANPPTEDQLKRIDQLLAHGYFLPNEPEVIKNYNLYKDKMDAAGANKTIGGLTMKLKKAGHTPPEVEV